MGRSLVAAGSVGALILGCARCDAQGIDRTATQSVEGNVQRLTTAPKGEIDGAVLDNGTWLHWPPHRQDQFSRALKIGDPVRATGRSESGPAGDEHFEVDTIVNSRTNQTIENPDFAIGPPPPPARRGRGPGRRPVPPAGPGRPPVRDAEPATEVQGRVTRTTSAPRGETDGVMLDNGTWLHWPPHLEGLFVPLTKVGENVRARGRTEIGPRGDQHFEIISLTNLRSNATAENPDGDFGPGAGPRGPGRRLPPRFVANERPPLSTPATQNAGEHEGNVTRLTMAPRGEVDGAMLDDGTALHWPPHLADRFADVVKVGERVRATGEQETGPAGDAHFEVSLVTNLRTNRSVQNPDAVDTRSVATEGSVSADLATRDSRLRDLEQQIEQLRREIQRLRQEK